MQEPTFSDPLEPTADEVQPHLEAAPPSNRPIRILLVVVIVLLVANLAAAGGLIMLTLRHRTDTAGGFTAVVSGLNDKVIGGINIMRSEQQGCLGQLTAAVATYAARYEERANQAVDLITKADNRISDKLKPLFSRIGVEVSDQVKARIDQTEEQRQLLSKQVETVTDGLKGMNARLANAENLLKSTNQLSEETRASVLASNSRIKDALDKLSSGRNDVSANADLLAQLEAMNREIAALTKQVASLQSKINRGF